MKSFKINTHSVQLENSVGDRVRISEIKNGGSKIRLRIGLNGKTVERPHARLFQERLQAWKNVGFEISDVTVREIDFN